MKNFILDSETRVIPYFNVSDKDSLFITDARGSNRAFPEMGVTVVQVIDILSDWFTHSDEHPGLNYFDVEDVRVKVVTGGKVRSLDHDYFIDLLGDALDNDMAVETLIRIIQGKQNFDSTNVVVNDNFVYYRQWLSEQLRNNLNHDVKDMSSTSNVDTFISPDKTRGEYKVRYAYLLKENPDFCLGTLYTDGKHYATILYMPNINRVEPIDEGSETLSGFNLDNFIKIPVAGDALTISDILAIL